MYKLILQRYFFETFNKWAKWPVTTKSQILAPEVMIPHRKWRIITRKWLNAGATWIMGLFYDQRISQ